MAHPQLPHKPTYTGIAPPQQLRHSNRKRRAGSSCCSWGRGSSRAVFTPDSRRGRGGGGICVVKHTRARTSTRRQATQRAPRHHRMQARNGQHTAHARARREGQRLGGVAALGVDSRRNGCGSGGRGWGTQRQPHRRPCIAVKLAVIDTQCGYDATEGHAVAARIGRRVNRRGVAASMSKRCCS